MVLVDWGEAEEGWADPDMDAAVRLFMRPRNRILFEYFAGCECGTGVPTDISVVARDTGIAKADITSFCKALYDANFGRYTIGRHGSRSRFKWRCQPAAVLAELTGTPIAADEGARAEATVEHRYRLRADLEISLELPPSLTKTEANRLALFIQSLPLDS